MMVLVGQDSTVVRIGTGSRRRARDGRDTVTLDGFGTAVARSNGISLADLSPIEELEIRTRNSCYHITVVEPATGRILVRGGAFFPVTSEARLGGASLGGSMLKLGWIGYGFCLEIHDSHQSIVTTPVCEIRRLEPGTGLGQTRL